MLIVKASSRNAIVLIFALFCAGCDTRSQSGDSGRDSPFPIRIATAKNVWNTLPIIAAEKGYFQDQGLDARLQFLAAGRYDLDALIAGAADVAMIVDVNIAYLGFTSNDDVRILGTIAKSSESAIVGRRESGIRTTADLVGKRIAYSPGTTSEIFLHRLLANAGLGQSSVRLVPIQPSGMFAAVTSGSVDAASTWEPFVHNISRVLGSEGVVFRDPSVYTGYMNIAVRRDWAAAHATQIKKMDAALKRAAEYAVTDPVDARRIIARVTNLDSATVSAIWPLFDLRLQNVNVELHSQVVSEGDLIRGTQRDFMGKPKPDYGKFFSSPGSN